MTRLNTTQATVAVHSRQRNSRSSGYPSSQYHHAGQHSSQRQAILKEIWLPVPPEPIEFS